MAQTEIQKPNAIRYGSAIISIGSDLNSLVNIGAIRDLSITNMGTVVKTQFDNADHTNSFRNGDLYSVKFNLAEINWDTISLMNDGEVTVENIAGTPVSGGEQVVVAGNWSFDKVIELTGKNASGAMPTINSVTLGTDGAIVLGTDYEVIKNESGNWAIAIKDTATVTTINQTVTIDSDYTPSASKKVTFKANGKRVSKFIRITNTDENGKELMWTLKGVTNIEPIAIDFAGDFEEDVATLPVSLEGRMVDIIDEQQTI